MDQQKVDMFLMSYAKYFEGRQIPSIRDRMLTLEDSKLAMILGANLKDPTTILIVSIVGGHFGIDRFMLGEVGMGVAKLLTCGGFGIWTIVDWFIIMGRTREINMQRIQPTLY